VTLPRRPPPCPVDADTEARAPAQQRPALWNRGFRLYFTARTVAMLGDSMLPVALSAGLLERGYGAGAIGAAMACYTGCFAGLVIFGGVIADRFDARRMMIGADATRACTQSLAAVLFLTGHITLWQICLIGAVNGTAGAMFQPGVASTVPRVAHDVQAANGVVRTAESLAMLAGPSLAGVLVGAFSPGVVFAVHASTYAVSGVSLLLLRLSGVLGAGVPAPRGGRRFRRELAEGWREFRSRTWMWSVIVVWMAFMVLVVGPITPLTAATVLPAHGTHVYGLLSSSLGAGTALGALGALRLRPRRPLRAGAFALLGYPLYPLAVGSGAAVPLLLGAVLVAGAASGFWGVMWATSVQTQVPGAVLNRIHAYEVAGSVAMLPVGQALSGPAAGAFGTSRVLLAGAPVTLGVALTLLSVPAVRGLRRVPGGGPVTVGRPDGDAR
jgi:MFS family permease